MPIGTRDLAGLETSQKLLDSLFAHLAFRYSPTLLSEVQQLMNLDMAARSATFEGAWLAIDEGLRALEMEISP